MKHSFFTRLKGRGLTLFFALFCVLGAQAGQFTVSVSTDDAQNPAAGSLRQAILDANASGEASTIVFSVANNTIIIINQVALPSLTVPITIEASGKGISLFSFAPLFPCFSLTTGSNGSVIKGLRIEGFSKAIQASGINNLQLGGTLAGEGLVLVKNDFGVNLSNVSGFYMAGCLVGTDENSSTNLGNYTQGVYLDNCTNFIIGAVPNAQSYAYQKNVFCKSGDAQIKVINSSLPGLKAIQGNYFDLSVDGITNIGNSKRDIAIDNSKGMEIGGSNDEQSNYYGDGTGIALNEVQEIELYKNYIGFNVNGAFVTRNLNNDNCLLVTNGRSITIGDIDKGNKIAGGKNVNMNFSDYSDLKIKSNYIGVDFGGQSIPSNVNQNILLNNYNYAGPSTYVPAVIGGENPAEGNIIAGAKIYNVSISYSNNDLIQNNKVGLDVTGLIPLSVFVNSISEGGGLNLIRSNTIVKSNQIAGVGNNYFAVQNSSNSTMVLEGNRIGLNLSEPTSGKCVSSGGLGILGKNNEIYFKSEPAFTLQNSFNTILNNKLVNKSGGSVKAISATQVNNRKLAPTIQNSAASSKIFGVCNVINGPIIAVEGDLVQVFSCSSASGQEALELLGEATVKADGTWEFTPTNGYQGYVVATKTDKTGRNGSNREETTELSAAVYVDICSCVVSNNTGYREVNGDALPGSLHAAIECANKNTDLNTISFSSSSTDIILFHQLPDIIHPVVIDGVGKNVSLLGMGRSINGLTIKSVSETPTIIKGLHLQEFNQAINIISASNVVLGGAGNGEGLVLIKNYNGVNANNSSKVYLLGNLIGTYFIGDNSSGNISHGVYFDNVDEFIVGARPSAGGLEYAKNVIANNGGPELEIFGCHGFGSKLVVGNYFDIALNGVGLLNSSYINESMVLNSSSNITIGGGQLADRNYFGLGLDISNSNSIKILNNNLGYDINGSFLNTTFADNRISIAYSQDIEIGRKGAGNHIASAYYNSILAAVVNNLRVKSNLIGTDYAGQNILPSSSYYSINIDNETIFQNSTFQGAIIGGSDPQEGNVISGAKFCAVQIFKSKGDIVENNKIGVAIDGLTPLNDWESNQSFQYGGIVSMSSPGLIIKSNQIVGGSTRGYVVAITGSAVLSSSMIDGNKIGLNNFNDPGSAWGVLLEWSNSIIKNNEIYFKWGKGITYVNRYNTILNNKLFDKSGNSQKAIFAPTAAVIKTPPIISSNASLSGKITGTVSTTDGSSVEGNLIQVFSCGSSGNEALSLLGEGRVTANGSWEVVPTVSYSGYVVATSTDATGRNGSNLEETTELSDPRLINVCNCVVTTNADNGDNNNPIIGSLRAAIKCANNNNDLSTITFSIQGETIAVASALPTITTPTIIDGVGKNITIESTTNNASFSGITVSVESNYSPQIKGLTLKSFKIGIDVNGSTGVKVGGELIEEGNILIGNNTGISIKLTTAAVVINNVIGNCASVGGEGGNGIEVVDNDYCRVFGNYIGIDRNSQTMQNSGYGIVIDAIGTTIGSKEQPNVISGNNLGGILVKGNTHNGNANGEGNQMSSNRIFNNKETGNADVPKAITLENNANNNKRPPTIDANQTSLSVVKGTCFNGVDQAGDVVELFEADASGKNAFILIGTTTVLANGTWEAQLSKQVDYVVATITDKGSSNGSGRNTSELSLPVSVSSVCAATVTNLLDNGPGSLRAAIGCANDNPNPTIIKFDLPQSTAYEIVLSTKLPNITTHVIVDGTTLTAFDTGARVRVKAGATGIATGFEFASGSDYSELKGLEVEGFNTGARVTLTSKFIKLGGIASAGNKFINNTNEAILIEGRNSEIQGNTIGEAGKGNGVGVRLTATSIYTLVGGSTVGIANVITGNTQQGVLITSADKYTILGNTIFGNANKAIDASTALNKQAVPMVTSISYTNGNIVVSGTSSSNAKVQLFGNATGSSQDATFLLGEGNGSNWSITLEYNNLKNNNIKYFVATSTNNAGLGNTSELSALVHINKAVIVNPLCSFDFSKRSDWKLTNPLSEAVVIDYGAVSQPASLQVTIPANSSKYINPELPGATLSFYSSGLLLTTANYGGNCGIIGKDKVCQGTLGEKYSLSSYPEGYTFQWVLNTTDDAKAITNSYNTTIQLPNTNQEAFVDFGSRNVSNNGVDVIYVKITNTALQFSTILSKNVTLSEPPFVFTENTIKPNIVCKDMSDVPLKLNYTASIGDNVSYTCPASNTACGYISSNKFNSVGLNVETNYEVAYLLTTTGGCRLSGSGNIRVVAKPTYLLKPQPEIVNPCATVASLNNYFSGGIDNDIHYPVVLGELTATPSNLAYSYSLKYRLAGTNNAYTEVSVAGAVNGWKSETIKSLGTNKYGFEIFFPRHGYDYQLLVKAVDISITDEFYSCSEISDFKLVNNVQSLNSKTPAIAQCPQEFNHYTLEILPANPDYTYIYYLRKENGDVTLLENKKGANKFNVREYGSVSVIIPELACLNSSEVRIDDNTSFSNTNVKEFFTNTNNFITSTQNLTKNQILLKCGKAGGVNFVRNYIQNLVCYNILGKECPPPGGGCGVGCIPSALLEKNGSGFKRYVVSAWTKEVGHVLPQPTYQSAKVKVTFTIVVPDVIVDGQIISYKECETCGSKRDFILSPAGSVIDGWQKIEGVVDTKQVLVNQTTRVPLGNDYFIGDVSVSLVGSADEAIDILYDDVRVYPFDANMNSFVYDESTLRLMAQLDENNYATYYEYDLEGNLVRVKKETERGVMTIQENRKNLKKR